MLKLTHADVVRTVELNPIELKGGGTLHLRLEVLKEGKRFVGRVHRWEFFRIQPTFPQQQGRPAHHPSDERVLVRDDGLFDEITATSSDRVVEDFFTQLRRRFRAR